MEQAPLSKVIALCDVLYNWKTIFLIKHVNSKLPKHGIKAKIGNRGFLMYKKYRCSYKHISHPIRNILKWFAAFKREFSLESSL